MTSTTTADEMKGLGANERAILGRIRWTPLRRVAVEVVLLKQRLQFTGWLQYVLPTVPMSALTLIGGLAWLVGGGWAGAVFLAPASLLALRAMFDIVTSKWRVRPAESRPAPLEHLSAFDLLRARRSCRSFQTRRMSEVDRRAVLDTIETHRATPTIGAISPRLEYIAAPLTVWPTVNASEFIVAIVPKPYDRMAIVDVGRTLQRVVMDATRMGLGTCWIGPGADHASITAQLGDRFDPETEHIVCVCAVGYASRFAPLAIRIFNRRMSTRRLPTAELFFADARLETPIDPGAPPYARYGRTFEACRWAPSSYNGQTTRAALEQRDGEVSAVRFFAATASRYYAPVALGIWCANWELGCRALGIEGHFEAEPAGGDENPPRHDVTWRPHPG